MSRALRVEWWKLRRSRVVVVATLLMAVLLPAMGLGIFSVADADTSGPMAAKIEGLLIGDGWQAYLGIISQTAAAAVFVGAGVVSAWVFGREHADRTFPSLFALTVSRRSIAVAKFVVLGGWLVVLSTAIALLAVVLGVLGNVGAFDPTVVSELGRLLFVVFSTGLLSLVAGYAASIGRGYLPAIGLLIVIVAIAQISVLFGTGGWFPFAVPGLVAIAGSDAAPRLSTVQFALLPVIVAAVVWLTVSWWQKAEVT